MRLLQAIEEHLLMFIKVSKAHICIEHFYFVVISFAVVFIYVFGVITLFR